MPSLIELINRNRAKTAQAQETEQRAAEVQGGAFSTIPPGPARIAPNAAAWVPPGAVRPEDVEVAETGQIPRLFEAGMLDVSSGVQNALAAAAQAVGADNVSAAAARSAQLDQERAAKLNPEMMTDIDEIGGPKGGVGTYIGQNMVRGLPTLGAMGLGGVLGGGLKGVAAASAALNTGDAYGQLSAAAKTPEQRAAIPGHAFAAGGFNAILDTLGFGFAARMTPVAKLALAKSLPAHVLQSAAVEGGTGAAQQYANIVATKHLLDNPDLFGLTPEDVHALQNAAAAEASAIAPLSVGGHLAHLPGQLAGQAVEGIQNFRNRGEAAAPEGVAPDGPEGPSFTQRAGDAVGAAVGGDFSQARDLGGDILSSARENIPGVDEAINKGAEFYQRAKTAAQPGVDEFMQKARDSATPEGAVMAARQAQQAVRSTADKVRESATHIKTLWEAAQKTQDPNVKKSGFSGRATPEQNSLFQTFKELAPFAPDDDNRFAAKVVDGLINDTRRFDAWLADPAVAKALGMQFDMTPDEFKRTVLTAARDQTPDTGREPGRGYDITDSAALMNAGDDMAGDDAKDSAALLQPELVDMLNEHGSLNDSGERNPHMNSKKFAEFLATAKDERAGTKAGSQVRVAVVRREEGKEPEVAIHSINLMNLAKAWGAGQQGGLPGQREMSVTDKERGESEAKRNRLNVVDGLDAMLGGWEETTTDGRKVTVEIQPVKAGEGKAPYSVVGKKAGGVGRTHAAFDKWLPDDAVIGFSEGKPVTWGDAKEDSKANAPVSHSSALDQHYKGVSGARWARQKIGESEDEEDRRIKAQTLDANGKVVQNKYVTDVEIARKSGADRAVRSIVNDILGGPDGVMMNLPEGEFQRAVNMTRKFLEEDYDTPIIDRLQESLRARKSPRSDREKDELKVGLERGARVALPEDLRALLDSTQNEELSAAYEEALGYVEKGVLAAVVFMPSEIRTAGKAELISQLGRLDARANIETLSEQETSVDNPDFNDKGRIPDQVTRPGTAEYRDRETTLGLTTPNVVRERSSGAFDHSERMREKALPEGREERVGETLLGLTPKAGATLLGKAGFSRDEEKPPYQSYEKLTKAGQEGMARTKAVQAARENLRRLYESSEATPSNKKMLRDVRDNFGSYTTPMLNKLASPDLKMSEVRAALKPTKKIPFVGGEPKPLKPSLTAFEGPEKPGADALPKTKAEQIIENSLAKRPIVHSSLDELSGKRATRLAFTDPRDGAVHLVEPNIVKDFKAGFEYPFNDVQKRIVMKQLGITKKDFAAKIKTVEDYKKFLAAHELSHVDNNDAESYPRKGDGSFDVLNKKAIDIEARATLDGFKALGDKAPKKAEPAEAPANGVTDLTKVRQDKEDAHFRRRVQEIVSGMSAEDLDTLKNDRMVAPDKRSILPAALRDGFREWLGDAYGEVERESRMASERQVETESEYLEYLVDGGPEESSPQIVALAKQILDTGKAGPRKTKASGVGSLFDTTDPAKQKELIDAIQKITGQKIGVAFDLQKGEAEYNSAQKMVHLAAMTGFSESNAFHEAFHAVSQHYLSSDQRKTLWKTFRQGAIRQQIKELLKDSPDAWESAKKDPEEMMAYGFQFWHAGMLELGRSPDSTVGKIFHYLLKKLNEVQDWLRDRPGAEELLQQIKEGAFADGGPSPVEIAAAKAARPNARIREVSKAIFEGLDKLYDAAVVPYDTRLRDLGNPHIDALARAMYTQVGEKTGRRGFAQEVPLQVAKRMNVLDKLARSNPRAYAQTLAEKAQGLPETNADMHKAVRGYLAEIEKYAKDAGVVMGHVEDYLPMSWDGNKIAAKRKDFIAMMKNHEMELKAVGFTPEEAADKMAQRGTATGEFVGPIFDENGAPTADHKLDRVFTFLSNAERAPFVRDDLASSMTRYTKQMVKRAEWARNFGDDNSKWDELVEKAREYGLKKEDEELLQSYKDDAFGLRLHDMNPTARKAVELNTVYQNYRVLSLSLLSNLIDPFGVAVRSGEWGEAWNSYKLAASRMFKSGRLKHAELQELAETIGTIERAGVQDSIHQQYGGVEIEGSARIANDALFRFNGMDGLTRSVRLAGLAAATRFLKHHAGLVGKGGNPRHLDELGIKAGDIQLNAAGQLKVLKEHGLDEETSNRVQAALNRFVDEAVLRPNIGERTKWGANPYLAPLYHLKQYVFSFNKVINKKLEHEFIEHDNTTPYAMASVYIPIMAVTAMLRDGITHGGELPPANGFMHYLGSGISRSGLLGPTEQMELAVGGGLSGNLNSVRQLAGPTADQGLDFVHAIANPHNTEVFKRFVKESLPGGNIWEHY